MDVAGLFLLVGLATSIWVMFDAPNHGLSWTWGLGCLALWIVAFPWYLATRSQVIRARAARPPAPAAPLAGWYPDPRNPERYERYREGTRWTSQIRERSDLAPGGQ